MLNCFGERVSTWTVFMVKLDLEGAVERRKQWPEGEAARGQGRSSVAPAPQEACGQTQPANSHLDSQSYLLCAGV